MSIWILVANATRARFFQAAARYGALEEIDDLVNPEERLQRQDMESDRPGRSSTRDGENRHGVAPTSDPKAILADRFAREVDERLQAALAEQRFEQLYVIAPPRFLGRLRAQMTPAVAAVLRGEWDKDLTRLDAAGLQEQMKQFA